MTELERRVESAITMLWVLLFLVGGLCIAALFVISAAESRLEDAGTTQSVVVPGK